MLASGVLAVGALAPAAAWVLLPARAKATVVEIEAEPPPGVPDEGAGGLAEGESQADAPDERLRTMLDSGTYSLEALDRASRVPIKQLGIAVAEQLV